MNMNRSKVEECTKCLCIGLIILAKKIVRTQTIKGKQVILKSNRLQWTEQLNTATKKRIYKTIGQNLIVIPERSSGNKRSKTELSIVKAGRHKNVDIQRMMNAGQTIIDEIEKNTALVWAQKKNSILQVTPKSREYHYLIT